MRVSEQVSVGRAFSISKSPAADGDIRPSNNPVAMQSFRMPNSPAQLLDGATDASIGVERPTAVADLSISAVQDFAEGVHRLPTSADLWVDKSQSEQHCRRDIRSCQRECLVHNQAAGV